MFSQEFDSAAGAAASKIKLLRENFIGYFLLSMLAGAFIGFGVLLAFTIGGLLTGFAGAKIMMGVSFGIALSLVVMAGGELFTGNNFVMTAGVIRKKVSLSDAILLWIVCWLGNLCGSVLLAFLYKGTGLGSGAVAEFMATAAYGKMSAGFLPLLTRGILCNILVCLAVWCGFRLKSETAKLVMIFWCLFAFITSGFEHSIANMTLLTISLLTPAGQAVTAGGFVWNLVIVTIGNMIGGILFVAVPYAAGARQK